MKITEVKLHRPIDPSDPGFTIPGYTLRWLSGKIVENNPGRPWVVLKREDFPPKALEQLHKVIPGAFLNGETVRKHDVVLAACPSDIAARLKQDARERAMEQERRTTPRQFDQKGRTVFEETVSDSKMEIDMERFKKHGG